MSVDLLGKLARCFPNIETLHMEGVSKCSNEIVGEGSNRKWEEMLRLLFDDEHTFPNIQNFFIGNIEKYLEGADKKLLAWKRPLKLLKVKDGASSIDFGRLITSPFRSTLTELCLGYWVNCEHFRYFSQLHNLRVLCLDISLNIVDDDIMHLKNLSNLEELSLSCGGQDNFLSEEDIIALFTLPDEHPEKYFPYKLRNLALTFLFVLKEAGLQTIARNNLVFLDLSLIRESYNNDVWKNLLDDDLPNLRYLGLHDNPVNIEDLQRLNLKRPKLLISMKGNHFINWTVTESGDIIFHDSFDADINTLMNDLCQIDGFSYCAMVTYFPD